MYSAFFISFIIYSVTIVFLLFFNITSYVVISFPSYKSNSGDYKDIVYPVSNEIREEISSKIIKEFNKLA